MTAGVDFSGRTAALIGGAAGIGFQVATRFVAAGGRVILGGRNQDRLAAAAATLGEAASHRRVDTADQDSLAAFFEGVETVDHLFVTAADYRVGPMRELTDADARSPFESKFWGQYFAIRHALPRIPPDGSIVLMSGAAGARPAGSAPAYVACNAALDGLGRGLAVELAPIRVNVVAPGTIDGNLWANRPAEIREAAFDQYRRETVLHRPGTEAEVADAVVFLFGNTFFTGTTLYPDGGWALR